MSEELADMQEWCNKKIGKQLEAWHVRCYTSYRTPDRIEFQFNDKAQSIEFYLVWSEYLD